MATCATGEGREIDDAALVRRGEVRQGIAGNKHRAGQIDVQCALPKGKVQHFDGAPADEVAGVVDQDVESPEKFRGASQPGCEHSASLVKSAEKHSARTPAGADCFNASAPSALV